MEFNHKVQMSIDDWREFADDEDVSLAYGKVTFLSTKPNSHHHVYSEKVLKEYAPTYLGKFIVTDYDKYTGDSQGHTNSQNIVGYIPTNQKVYYDRDEDGYLQATVDVTLSKIYAPDVYKLFKENNYRAVSVEQLVGFTPETENYDDGTYDKEVVGFEGIGITILGLRYAPSVPTASIKLTKMSADNIENIEKEYAQYAEKEGTVSHSVNTSKDALDTGDWNGDKAKDDLIKEKNFNTLAKKVCMKLEEGWEDKKKGSLKYPVMNLKDNEWVYNREGLSSALAYAQQHDPSVATKIKGIYKKLGLDKEEKMSQILSKLESIEETLDNFREEKMAENKDKEKELEKDKEKEKMAEKGKETEDTSKEKEKEKMAQEEKEMAEKNKDKEKPEDKEDDMKDDKMACGGGGKDKAKMSQEIEELKIELSEKEKVIASQLSELKELRAFKSDYKKNQKDSVVTATLSKVKEYVDSDTFENFKTSAESCKFEDINGWKNEVLASITEKVLMSENHEDGIMDMGLPSYTERKTSIYD